jgi:hypothetical protein
MRIRFERDSVSAGDDIMAPNTRHLEFAAPLPLSEVLHPDGPVRDYLPCVSKSRTFWTAYTGSERVADVIFTCEPRRMVSVQMQIEDRPATPETIFFRYTGQERVV